MRTVVHLSDVHFGRVDRATVEPLVAFVRDVRPDLVAVSGDLTQRARRAEFEQARDFLDSLPAPQIVVPGNHDVPLYDVYARFAYPLERFRRYLRRDPEPAWADDEIAVLGVNSARSFVFKGGRINPRQVARIREWLCPFGPGVTKIIVTHHPFDLPAGMRDRLLVGRARMVMERLADCGADVFLAGHLHLAHLGLSTERYRVPGVPALIIQAGTATSTRGRGEVNSFNVLRIRHPELDVEHVAWNAGSGRFALTAVRRFRRGAAGWEKV